MINIRDFKTKEEGRYRVAQLQMCLKEVGGDSLFYKAYCDRHVGVFARRIDVSLRADKNDWITVPRKLAEEDLKFIEKRLRLIEAFNSLPTEAVQMLWDKGTPHIHDERTISEEDLESIKISLAQSDAGIVDSFDLDEYLIPERNELPTLEEQVGYFEGSTPASIEFHYAEGKSITMTELIDKIDKAIQAADTIQQYYQSGKPL